MKENTKQKIQLVSITNSPVFVCTLFILLTAILGIISLASTGTPIFNWTALPMPFSMANWILPVSYLALFIMLAESVCIMWLTKIDHKENKITNLIWHLSVITLLALWPMFILLFNLPVVAAILLVIASVLMIITTYRFMTSSVWAGSMYVLCTLYALALLVLNFWIVFR